VGGKWTTYRALAEQTADAVLWRLIRSRMADT
jgi:glycerol-3-phosphate dehydrogenase